MEPRQAVSEMTADSAAARQLEDVDAEDKGGAGRCVVVDDGISPNDAH